MAKTDTPERGSRVLNKVWENEEFFTKRDQENIDGGTRNRFRSLEPTNSNKKRKQALHDHRIDPAQFSTMNTFH